MKLCERLRELRKERGLKLKQVTFSAGITVAYLSDLERGRTNPSLDILGVLAKTYRISVRDLLECVEFGGVGSGVGLPNGLAELQADPVLGAELTPEWIRTLSRIEVRGKRPQEKQEWFEIFLYLKRILEKP